MGKQKEGREGTPRDAGVDFYCTSFLHGLCHFLMMLWGGGFILIEKIKVLVTEKWLSTEVKNTGFAIRLPRLEHSLCPWRVTWLVSRVFSLPEPVSEAIAVPMSCGHGKRWHVRRARETPGPVARAQPVSALSIYILWARQHKQGKKQKSIIPHADRTVGEAR